MDSTLEECSNSSNMINDGYSTPRILCMCGGIMAAQFMFSYSFALTAPLARQLAFSKTWTQVFSAFGPIAGGVIQPLIGFFSDRVHSRYGRRRPFIVVGQIGTGIALVMQIFVFQVIDHKYLKARQILYVISLIMVNCFVQAIQGPSRTLIADLLPSYQQVLGNAMATSMIAFASITCNLLGFILIIKPQDNFFKLEVFVPFLSLIFAVMGTVMTCITTKEVPTNIDKDYQNVEEQAERKNPLKEIVDTIKNIDRPVIIVAVLLLVSWAAYYPFTYNATGYYAVDIYNADPDEPDSETYKKGIGHGMLMIAINNVITLCSGYINQKLIDSVGPKIPYAASQLIECAVLIAAIFMKKEWLATFLFALLGISQSIFNIVPYTIVGICVAKSQMGMVMGSLNIFVVLGQLITGTLICPFVASDDKHVKGKLGPVIAVGSPFALAAAVICIFLTIPERKDERDTLNDELIVPVSDQ
ncbi:major facilitator superfamily transporter [Tritrichomonas foetus]|uniref:Major facilitator superfamily transporter n=1 Tax=Tritrichomonas foetus TaxID=1144522 RepID=A0A1J4KAE2_9EUKA|nr:major facilitator superfamily transporter [Tritrichomonas foetus]|eukprot:OHT07930.1 major facilitator superfamily transporter [Tritrichomonas foetus]